MKLHVWSCVVVLLLAAGLLAQTPPAGAPGGSGPTAPGMVRGPNVFYQELTDGGPHGGPMMGHGPQVFFHAHTPDGPGGMGEGKWWKDSRLVQEMGLTDPQVQQIEKIFQDHRLQLIDLHAGLQKQEAILEPLMEADRPDEAQVTAQIDKVAQARAALEKSHAQMLLGIRRVLSVEQWKKLHSAHHMPGPPPPPPMPRGEMD